MKKPLLLAAGLLLALAITWLSLEDTELLPYVVVGALVL